MSIADMSAAKTQSDELTCPSRSTWWGLSEFGRSVPGASFLPAPLAARRVRDLIILLIVIASGLIAMIKPFLKAFRDPLVGIRFALEARDLFEMPVGPSRRNAPLVLSFGAPDLQDRDRAGRHRLPVVIGHWSVSL